MLPRLVAALLWLAALSGPLVGIAVVGGYGPATTAAAGQFDFHATSAIGQPWAAPTQMRLSTAAGGSMATAPAHSHAFGFSRSRSIATHTVGNPEPNAARRTAGWSANSRGYHATGPPVSVAVIPQRKSLARLA